LIWDEAAELLKPHRTVEVKLVDLDKTIVELAVKAPDAFDALRPLLTGALHQYISGAIKQPKYGLSDAQIKAALPQLGTIDITAVRAALKPDLNVLNTTSEFEVELSDLPRGVRRRFTDSDVEAAEKIKSSFVLDWLPDFLDVWAGNVVGALNIQHGVLTITLPEQRLADIAREAKANIFLDATARAEDLARLLGVSVIPVIRQQQPDTNNLEIVQVATLGRLGVGSARSEFCQGRLDALVAQLQNNHPDLAIIDFKRFSEVSYEHRNWWTDSRGINDLDNCSALALIGTPCRNLASLAAEFTVLHERSPAEGTTTVRYPIKVKGNLPDDIQPYFEMESSVDPEFREFCHHRVLADVSQAIGRLRAGRRPNQKLIVYFIADFPLDCEVTLKKASDITPDAATKTERVELAIRGAVKQLKVAGQKVTQGAIAAITGYSQQHISRFKNLLILLLVDSNSKMSKNSDPPPDPGETQWLSAEYLPLLSESPPDELLEGIRVVFEVYGATVFKRIWGATSALAQIKILKMLLLTLPESEFRALAAAAEVRL
jgi:hypothetical protein